MPLLKNLVLIFIFMYLSTDTLADNTITKDSSLHSNARIYRGQDAPKNKYPFYVDLFITFENAKDEKGEKLQHHGSGIMISKIHILICAHIFYPYMGKNKYVKDTYNGEAYAGGLDVAAFINSTSEPLENVDFSESEVTIYPGENKILLTDIFKFHMVLNIHLVIIYDL